MTLKLSNEFNELRDKLVNSMSEGKTQEEQMEIFASMMEAMKDDCEKSAQKSVEAMMALTPEEMKMTARERKFFNEIDKTIATGATELLPEETVDRIFENLTTAHPLLEAIGLKNAGIRLKFLSSEATGKAEWKDVFGEITGQLKAAFNESKDIQHKLTAFVVIPKDAFKFGPAWIQNYVITQINEAFSVALEAAFLNGDGAHKPVGLAMQLTGSVSGDVTTYPVKSATGTLTFKDSATTVSELTNVHKHHSTDAKGNPVQVEGNVVMVVNPADAWDVKKQYTSLNAQGVYVTALPYNITLIESIAQTAGKVTTFVKGRYDAYVAGGIEIKKYTETLALEDMDLYTAKQFAYGKARDEKAAAVWTLSVTTPGA